MEEWKNGRMHAALLVNSQRVAVPTAKFPILPIIHSSMLPCFHPSAETA
jgi:hypothetical protein